MIKNIILSTIFASALSVPISAQTSHLCNDTKGHMCITDGNSIWYADDPSSQWISLASPVGSNCTWIDYIAPKTLAACVEKDGEGRIYVSTNNGKTWKIKKVASKPCSAAFYSDDCGLMVSFSDTDILQSMDEGRTWKTIKTPATPSVHITDICMLSNKEGLFGLSANKILRTADGGKTFKSIPTPLDMAQRSTDTKIFGNGIVTQIMRIGRYYVAKQGSYFITNYDDINWQIMPDVTYATITNAGTFMTVSSDNSVQEYDDKLNRSWKKSLTNDKKQHTTSSICVDVNYAYVNFDNKIWRTDGDSVNVFTPTNLEGNNLPYTLPTPEVAVESNTKPSVKHNAEHEKAIDFFLNQDYDRAFPLLEALSENGDNEILENLAYCYEEGKGTEQNYSKAAQLYARAANNGSDFALLNLGHYLLNGWGVQKDTVRALQLWDRAADHGYDFANQDLANHYIYEGNAEKAAKYIGKSVALGNIDATYKYAMLIMDGIGVKRDSIQGMNYLKKAADHGVTEAMTYVGDAYISGRILPQNPLLGITYFEKAIEKGDIYAKKFLARCYMKGEGTDRNNKLGFMLLKEAADAGDEEAYNGVASCFLEGAGTLPDPEMAIHYLKLAEASGDTSATLKIKDVQNTMARTQYQKK